MNSSCRACTNAQRAAATTDAPVTCADCGTTWEPFPPTAANDGAPEGDEFGECRGCIDARDAIERLCDRNADPWALCDECLAIVSLDPRNEHNVERVGEPSARASRRAMLADFDNLARWRPRLERRGFRGSSNREPERRSRNDLREGFARAVETERRLAGLRSAAAAEAARRASRRAADGRESPPTDLERAVAVLEWIVDHRGVRRRTGLVRAIGRAFAAKEKRAYGSAKSASTRLGAELLFLAESLWAATVVPVSHERSSDCFGQSAVGS